ncbi:MAG: hypothetical protein QNJ16_22165 [Rhodobacter sp.]|nr:hypothetical protein [Gammaproteobacteria bacterium]MDJ0828190.1 hypothetical protein [Rhodobacter sp.]
MENDIFAAPAGYMFIYVSVLAFFAWNFYRVLRLRTRAVRIEERHSSRPQAGRHDHSDSRKAA